MSLSSDVATKSLSDLKAAMLPKATRVGVGFDLTNNNEPGSPEYAKGEESRLASLVDLDAYLTGFAQPDKDIPCISCGTAQVGMEVFLSGGFTWGIAHGEGYCSACGYPARRFHRLTVAAGDLWFDRVLQYHPDVLEERGQP